MISHDLRCIFIHIPKCAGSSIEDALWPGARSVDDLWMGFVDDYRNPYQTGGLQHLTASLVRDIVGRDTFHSYYRFAVIRNPYDKAVSQYEFMKRRPDLRAYIGMDEHDGFKRYLELIARRVHVQWQSQHRFLYDEDGTLLVDDVLRFERLHDEMAIPFSKLGVSPPLPHRKAGRRGGPLSSYYDNEAREMLAHLYTEDLQRFGYEYPADQNS